MKDKILSIILLISVSYMSCNQKLAVETNSFQKYLTNSFNEKIPYEKHTYLLIATFRCSGCVENALLMISKKINANSINKITILTFNTSLIPGALKDKVKILIDKDTGYEKIDIAIANIALIQTSKGKIDKIRILNLDDTEKIIDDEL